MHYLPDMDQPRYYSHSRAQWISVRKMPTPHLFNAYAKLASALDAIYEDEKLTPQEYAQAWSETEAQFQAVREEILRRNPAVTLTPSLKLETAGADDRDSTEWFDFQNDGEEQ